MHKIRQHGFIFLRQCLVWGLVAGWVLPLFWMVTASLRKPGMPIPRTVEWIPSDPVLTSYERVPDLIPLGRMLGNSLLIIAIAVPLTIITASLSGFAISQLAPKARRRWLLALLLFMMVPGSAVWLPRFILFTHLNLIDTFAALIAPACMGTSPLFVLVYYGTFRRLEPETLDAARLDGAGVLALWRLIALPLSRPTTIVVGVLTAMMYWNDYQSPLLYLKSAQRYTLPVGIQMLQQFDRTSWAVLMAGAVLMSVPVLLGFVAIQRLFWAGVEDMRNG